MSKNRRSEASEDCPSGKTRSLPSKELALNTAILLTWRSGEQLYPHWCWDGCGHWHVTRDKRAARHLSDEDLRKLGVER